MACPPLKKLALLSQFGAGRASYIHRKKVGSALQVPLSYILDDADQHLDRGADEALPLFGGPKGGVAVGALVGGLVDPPVAGDLGPARSDCGGWPSFCRRSALTHSGCKAIITEVSISPACPQP